MNLSQMFLLYANRIDRHKRAELTGVLARAYAGQKVPHPDQDNILLALMAMAADPALEVRRALSEVVSGSNQFPRSLHLVLVKDVAQVSEPVYARSTLLPDAELLTGLSSHNQWVQCAIAGRPELSPEVVEAIAKTACSAAVLKLLVNHESQLTPDASELIWQRFEDPTHTDHKHVMAYLLRRPDVSSFVKLKIDFLEDATGEPPLSDLKNLERRLDRIIMRTAQAERQELSHIAFFLHERKWLNTFVVIRAALAGQFDFTVALLARASTLQPANAARLCRMGGVGLRILCRLAGISKQSARVLNMILQEGKSLQDGQKLGHQAVSRVIGMMEGQGISPEDALYCILLQIEAGLLAENAQQVRYDLVLKAIAQPDVPAPSAWQDDVVGQNPSTDTAKPEKPLQRPFKTTGTGTFGVFSSGTLAYKSV